MYPAKISVAVNNAVIVLVAVLVAVLVVLVALSGVLFMASCSPFLAVFSSLLAASPGFYHHLKRLKSDARIYPFVSAFSAISM